MLFLRILKQFLLTFPAGLLLAGSSFAALPPNLPGTEITDQVIKTTLFPDTAKVNTGKTDSIKPHVIWFDKAAKTWEAPSLSEQISKDPTRVPMGKGGIFVPRMTELHDEPDIEVVDTTGKSIASGEPGITYSVEPGSYFVMIGSGTHKQRIVRRIQVQEMKTTPVIPDWCGLIIETIDTNATSFKGEYELIRIDEFEALGRGNGADVSLGEAVKAWILKPGIYKILGRGENYTTLKNFITVRLQPGELTRVVLIEREFDYAILGGGTVDLTSGQKITSNWKYGGSVGGNTQYVNKVDRKNDIKNKDYSSLLSLYSSLWLRYLKKPIEWETSVSLNEGFNIYKKSSSGFSILSTTDDFKLRSLFIWRFLSWLGPYGSTELNTNLLQKNIQRDEKDYFLILDKGDTVNTDNLITSSTHKLSPSFSPLNIDVGSGVNIDAIDATFLDISIRLGAGSSYNSFPDKYTEVPKNKAIFDSLQSDLIDKSILLKFEPHTTVFEIGPLCYITSNLTIGRFGSAGASLKVFFPKNRLKKPDYDLNTILSWRIARGVTLDYEYSYILKQPKNEDAVVNTSTNTLNLRFSFSSR